MTIKLRVSNQIFPAVKWIIGKVTILTRVSQPGSTALNRDQ
jgi:hypothetical protein